MKIVIRLLIPLALGLIVTSAAEAAPVDLNEVGSFTFNAPDDIFDVQNEVVNGVYPDDFVFHVNYGSRYRAKLLNETGITDLAMQWFGLAGPVPVTGAGASAILDTTLAAGTTDYLRITGSGNGSYRLTVRPLPIPAAFFLFLSGLGAIGYAGRKTLPKMTRT